MTEENTPKRRPVGRPRKTLTTAQYDSVSVLVEGAESLPLKYGQVGSSTATPVCVISIPNWLLYQWHNESEKKKSTYIEMVNDSITGKIVTLDPHSERLESTIKKRASTVACRIKATRGSTGKDRLLEARTKVFVLEGETLSCADIMTELDHAREQAELWKREKEELQEEVDNLYIQMAREISRYLDELEHKEAASNLPTTSPEAHKGKPIEDVSPRQARRTMNKFKSYAGNALWFAETFGLIPQSLQVKLAKSGTLKAISLTEQEPDQTSAAPTMTDEDRHKVLQTLFLLDRFGVGDSFYHELTMINPNLPRSYLVKQARRDIDQSIPLRRVPEPHDGAYRPFMDALTSELTQQITKHPEHFPEGETIKIKLSGDGARFSRTSNFILLSFSILNTSSEVLSGRGNHTFAVARGGEDYSFVEGAFRDVFSEVNAAIRVGEVSINGRSFAVEYYLGGDYKYLLMILSLNAANAKYSCVWCHIHSDHRWDMSIPIDKYNSAENNGMVRSLDSLKECAKLPASAPASKRLGSIRMPLIDISLDHVVIDELHLLLRIVDILIRNLIIEMKRRDLKGRSGRENIDKLIAKIRECGISFNIWEDKEADNSRKGSLKWTSITGKDRKRLIEKLPDKIPELLTNPAVANKVVQIWKDFKSLYATISSWNPTATDKDTLHDKAKAWITLFLSVKDDLQGHQRENITPYMHAMVFHVPAQMQKYGNVKQFSGQGVEKNNDDARRNYFSSNRWDACGDILRTEVRIERLGEYQRPKRKYSKKDEEYWDHKKQEQSQAKRRCLAQLNN